MTLYAQALVRRQTPQSAFSHLAVFNKGPWPPAQRWRLLSFLIEDSINRCDYEASPAKDAICVNLPAFSENYAFMTPIAHISTLPPTVQFETYITARSEGEESYLCTHANILGDLCEVKTRAKSCQAILYLRENQVHERVPAVHCAGAFHLYDWDLVSLNASPDAEHTPQHPESMARNQLGMIGGSEATYSSEQWARSVHYWGCHVRLRSAEPQTLEDSQYWGK